MGRVMPHYCFFGDTMNVASRMESTGEPGKIQTSSQFAAALDSESIAANCSDSEDIIRGVDMGGTGGAIPSWYRLLPRGAVEVKGKGLLDTFWLHSGYGQWVEGDGRERSK